MSKLANFDAMHQATGNVRVIVITHPRKAGSRAEIVVKFPKDGAGRLQAWCADYFGLRGCDGVQYGSAGGYGYDKQTAALSNFTIDGHALADHCGQDATSARLVKQYGKAGDDDARRKVADRARKLGYSFANWRDGKGWTSCYREPGLDYLRALGYNVVTVG